MSDDSFRIAHTIWSGALSVLGGLIVWNWNRLNKQVDGKADKTEVQTLREDIAGWRQSQETQHAENRSRLDDIYQLLAGKR